MSRKAVLLLLLISLGCKAQRLVWGIEFGQNILQTPRQAVAIDRRGVFVLSEGDGGSYGALGVYGHYNHPHSSWGVMFSFYRGHFFSLPLSIASYYDAARGIHPSFQWQVDPSLYGGIIPEPYDYYHYLPGQIKLQPPWFTGILRAQSSRYELIPTWRLPALHKNIEVRILGGISFSKTKIIDLRKNSYFGGGRMAVDELFRGVVKASPFKSVQWLWGVQIRYAGVNIMYRVYTPTHLSTSVDWGGQSTSFSLNRYGSLISVQLPVFRIWD
ncbi:MAG: hypothetical protein KatS3mg033_1512 [Thermonema sp.]|uniref:hypothetical protein n=1 Tax=Thermonema sp. TaxID=2231181 RepID=UPI0021DF3622|nr:hypothetical protein [Thermonema sp.]GIV39712.1 MAG: hypothetical protein KatS3mg033_1512 [Thermonema sp.]